MIIGQVILWVFLGLVGLLLLVFIYGGTKNRITRNKQMRLFSNIFGDKNFPVPTIVFGHSYWWPTYRITFDSLISYQNAKQQGLLSNFEKGIADFYDSDFDPTSAITYLLPNNKQISQADT